MKQLVLMTLLVCFLFDRSLGSVPSEHTTFLSKTSTSLSESFSSYFLSSIKFEKTIKLNNSLLDRLLSRSNLLFSVENTTLILDLKNLNQFKLTNLEFDYKIQTINQKEKKLIWDQGKISLGNVSMDMKFDFFTIPHFTLSNSSLPLQFVNISSLQLLQDFDLKIKSKLLGKTISEVLGDSISQIIIPIFIEKIEIVLMNSITRIVNILINVLVAILISIWVLKSVRKVF